MNFENQMNPFNPFSESVAQLRASFSATHPERTIHRLSSVHKAMFHLHTGYHADPSQPIAADIKQFLDHLWRLGTATPYSQELDLAPELCRWCAVNNNGFPRLIGHVLGHPTLGWGARILTSPLLQVSCDRGWARTWSRFYILAEYVPTTLSDMQSEGVIPAGVELIPFD